MTTTWHRDRRLPGRRLLRVLHPDARHGRPDRQPRHPPASARLRAAAHGASAPRLLRRGDRHGVRGVRRRHAGRGGPRRHHGDRRDGRPESSPTSGGRLPRAAARQASRSRACATARPATSRSANTFSTNQFGEVGLATGSKPLIQPTEVAAPAPRRPARADGATTRARSSSTTARRPTSSRPTTASSDPPLPVLDPRPPRPRRRDRRRSPTPVVVDFRNNALEVPAADQQVARRRGSAGDVREHPDRAAVRETVGGDLKVALVQRAELLHDARSASDVAGCTSFNDRDRRPGHGQHCTGSDPRGAPGRGRPRSASRPRSSRRSTRSTPTSSVCWRSRTRRSRRRHRGRGARARLVAALNAAAGAGTWALRPVVGRAARRPPSRTSSRNAIIYQPAAVDAGRRVARAGHAQRGRRGVRQRPRADRPGVHAGRRRRRRSSSSSTTSSRRARPDRCPATPTPATARAPRTPRASPRPRRCATGSRRSRRDAAVARLPRRRLQLLHAGGPAAGPLRRRATPTSATTLAPGAVLVLVRRRCRARSTTCSLNAAGARPGHRRGHLEHQRRASPSPSSTAATTTTAPLLRAPTRTAPRDHDPVIVGLDAPPATDRVDLDPAEHQRLPRPHRHQHGEVRRHRRAAAGRAPRTADTRVRLGR